MKHLKEEMTQDARRFGLESSQQTGCLPYVTFTNISNTKNH